MHLWHNAKCIKNKGTLVNDKKEDAPKAGLKIHMHNNCTDSTSSFLNNSKQPVKVITSGSSYLDIDAYGGCIAYAELLNLLGYEAKAVSSAKLNESITPTIRSWGRKLDHYLPKFYLISAM